MIEIDIMGVKKHDIIRFKSYAMRVDEEPVLKPNAIVLRGRVSTGGCPLVTKHFITGLLVKVERNETA